MKLEKIKPEDVYYYEDISVTSQISTTASGQATFHPSLQARMNVQPLIDKINEIIDKLDKVSK